MGLRRASARLLVVALVAASAVGVTWTRPSATPARADVAPASWWAGDCDTDYWTPKARSLGWTGSAAHRLGASYLGIPACGPRPSVEGSPNVVWRRAGWGEYEWQCVELAQRFMAQVYGVKAYQANGNQVVSHYSTSYGGGLVRINNGTPGQAPQPGDVISYNSSTNSNGHVAVVTSSAVDGAGNGTVMTMEQNYSANGWRGLTVKGWKVQPSGNLTPYGWLHDPQERGNPGAVLPTSMNLLSNSSFELGTGTGWVAGARATSLTLSSVVTSAAAPANEGAKVLRMQTVAYNSSIWQDVTTTTPVGRSYTFSAWVRSPSGTQVSGRLLLSTNGGTLERGETSFTVGPKWQLVSAPLPITLTGHTGLRAEVVQWDVNTPLDVDGTQLVDAGLANASFEKAGSGWKAWNLPTALTASAGTDASYSVEGTGSMGITAATAGASIGQSVVAVPQVNHAYTFSAWLRTPDGAPAASGQLKLSALGGTWEHAAQSFTVGPQWTLVSVPLSVVLTKHTSFVVEVALTSTGRRLDVDATQLADDRLQNASLEQGTSGVGWTPYTAAASLSHSVLTSTFAHDGSNYLNLRATTSGASIRQTPAVVPVAGHTYNFSAWLRSASGTVSGRLRVMTIGGTVQSGQTLFTVGPKWTHVSAPLSVTTNGHSGLSVEVVLTTVNANLAVDGTTLVAGDSRDADITAPALTMRARPAAQVRSTAATFSYGASDPDDAASALTYSCTLDGVTSACGTSRSLTGLAQGMHTFSVVSRDAVGNVSEPAGWSWLVDTVAPTATMHSPGTVFALVNRAQIDWSGADSGSGVAGYDVRRRGAFWYGDFSPWTQPAALTGLTATDLDGGAVYPGGTYCFEVRAHDAVGNVSAWSPQRCVSVPLDERAMTRSAGWFTTSSSRFYQQTAVTTTHAGSWLSRPGAKVSRVALVVTRCPSCGKVGVYVGSSLVGTVDLAAAATAYQQVVVLPAFSLRSGTVRVQVLSSGKLVQVDGIGLTQG